MRIKIVAIQHGGNDTLVEELPFCECGCGVRVTKPGNRFLRGHHTRLKPPTQTESAKMVNGSTNVKGLICTNCGNVIKSRRDVLRANNFCSRACYDEWQSKNIRGEKRHNWKGGKQSVICDNCGKTIEKPPSHTTDKNFCSQRCHGKWQSKNANSENNHNWRGGAKTITCDNCGKTIERKRSHVRTDNFCSYKCMGEWRSKSKRFGQKISATKQGISYDEWEGFAKDHPYCPAFNEACRESNREKYGRKCFLCGLNESDNTTKNGKQKKLSVHHVDMDKQQGCENKRWKLVPVCNHHHGTAHTDLWEARITWMLDNVYVYDNEYVPDDYKGNTEK